MAVIDFIAPLQASRVTAHFKPGPYNALWISMAQSAAARSQYFSLDLLHEVCALHKTIEASAGAWVHHGALQPIHYAVMTSAHPDYFSLGGDLGYFRECIAQRNRRALHEYSMLCVDMIYDFSTQMNRHATTIALVQGRALGGGFEAALAADYIIAEEHSEFGFPEILFGLFPCTGGMSLLARRIGVYAAERMMTNGRMYGAAELRDMGVIDAVCSKGDGVFAAEKFIAAHARNRTARLMLQRGRHRLARLDYEELSTVVDEWVEAALSMTPENLRVMDMLIQMQRAAVAG